MDMNKEIKYLFINYNISYIEVNKDDELNEIDKEELLKILDFDIKFEKEEILISDNIKINNFNGNKLINFVFNYYYTDNESLKVFLKDVIKDIIMYGYKEDRKI